MSLGIAQKLNTTYLIIILASMVSGGWCLYVLDANLRANSEMRNVSLPSIEGLKEMRSQMQQVKKLTDAWVYVAGSRDKERLENIISTEYPQLYERLRRTAANWHNDSERNLFADVSARGRHVMDSVRKVTSLLSRPEFYVNDPIVDYAATLNIAIDRLIKENDPLLDELIKTKEDHLVEQQNRITYLLHALYLIVAGSIIVVIVTSIIASRYSRFKIVAPILQLDKMMLDMAAGKVVPFKEVKRKDEIGEMQHSANMMISGILQKIEFAEQIGRGNYDKISVLLSAEDKFGIALQNMRDDLRRSNELMVEQGKRLIDAQKLARIGNYYIDLETNELQTSPTLDDILGFRSTSRASTIRWQDHVLPEFHAAIAQKAITAMKTRVRFTDTYAIKRPSDGKEIWVHAIGDYHYDTNGRAISMFGTLQDVTESKLLEIELNNAVTISRNQNERLLNFSYIVSHNLRMHAVNIHGLLGILKDTKTEEERETIMGYLFTTSEKLDETLHHLNDVVAIQNRLKTQKVPVALRTAVNNALSSLKTQAAEKNAIIHNDIADTVIVNYNAVYLDSILLNLLSNAIKYSSSSRRPEITISCPEPDVLQVTDNGMGIDLDVNGSKLFGMYKTFHGNADAKGVGLFMTKYQVEAMGGSITVESRPDKGTTFRVHINNIA